MAKNIAEQQPYFLDEISMLLPWDGQRNFWNKERNRQYHYAIPNKDSLSNITSIALRGRVENRLNAPRSLFTLLGINKFPTNEYSITGYSLSTTVLIHDQEYKWMDGQQVTQGLTVNYSTQLPKWTIECGCYIYGNPYDVVDALNDMQVNAMFMNELPYDLDVMATINEFMQRLRNQDFSTPPFILNK